MRRRPRAMLGHSGARGWLRTARSEARRSAAGVLAAAVAAGGGVMLAVHPDLWAGRWAGLASFARGSLVLGLPLVAAVACWHGGRDRRCGVGDLLASTPRPALARTSPPLAVLTLAGVAGLGVPCAAAGVLIGRLHAFGTAWWWVQLVVAFPAVAAAVALGLLVGRWLPWRAVPALVAAALYGGLVVADAGRPLVSTWLSPLRVADADQLVPVRGAWGQVAWLSGVTLVLLAFASAPPPVVSFWGRSALRDRARVGAVAALGAAVAAAGVVTLQVLPQKAGFAGDPRALELVCDDGVPQVCLARVDAFLLEDVTGRVRPVLRRLASVPGGPPRAAQTAPEYLGGSPAGPDVLQIPWHLSPTVGGRLLVDSRHGDVLEGMLQNAVGSGVCEEPIVDDVPRGSRLSAQWLVYAWAADTARPQLWMDDVTLPGRLERLRSASMTWQRAWVGDALPLLRRCDTDAELDSLLARLAAA